MDRRTTWPLALALAFGAGPWACGGDDDDVGGEGEGERGLSFCTDELDNDDDGRIDCFDQTCLEFQEECAPVPFTDDEDDALPAAAADFSCLHANPGPEPTGENVSVRLYAEDFEHEDRIEGVTVEVFLGNRIEGQPDLTLGPTDEEGLTLAADLPANQRVATRVLGVAQVVRTTVQLDVLTPSEDGELRALVVADSTYRIVPAAVAVSIDSGRGIIAGQFKDCEGEAVAGLIAEVEGQPADIRYFVDDFPARDPNVTTRDGLYVAINVAPGDRQLVLRGRLEEGGDLVEVGRREVQVIADSIVIADLEPLAE